MKIITLTTDFGISDWYVACLKGVIYSINPQVNIVDITHQVPNQDILAASFIVRNSDYFPQGTIHVVVVDPEVGSSRKAIVALLSNQQIYVCPDNGILSFILGKHSLLKAFVIENQKICRETVSCTFHGRDIFAPVAAWLSLGSEIESVGSEIRELCILKENLVLRKDDGIQGCIIYIDKFGNLISNIEKTMLSGKVFKGLLDGQLIEKVGTRYSEVQIGEPLVLFSSEQFVEISVNQGSAESYFKAHRLSTLELFYE
jgi:S-adenosylmethionine hydrolase